MSDPLPPRLSIEVADGCNNVDVYFGCDPVVRWRGVRWRPVIQWESKAGTAFRTRYGRPCRDRDRSIRWLWDRWREMQEAAEPDGEDA